jgi:hypothetical protein
VREYFQALEPDILNKPDDTMGQIGETMAGSAYPLICPELRKIRADYSKLVHLTIARPTLVRLHLASLAQQARSAPITRPLPSSL